MRGRLRARLMNNELDRKVAARMQDAQRAAVSAIRDVQVYLKTTKNPVEVRNGRRVLRDLNAVLGAISGVHTVHSLYGGVSDEESAPVEKPKKPDPEVPPTTR